MQRNRRKPARKPAGRPPSINPKRVMTIRLDAGTLDAWRASGSGWQTRINQLLSDYAPSPLTDKAVDAFLASCPPADPERTERIRRRFAAKGGQS